ncbi:MAG: hypothetical protein ABI551_15115 [Polyangiaceae bacterium]
MSTDCNATIEILRPARIFGTHWAKITLDRDYQLFDLIAGARSDDASLAIFPPRALAPGGEVWTGATWLWAVELDAVASAYAERCGREATEPRAIAAAMHLLNGRDAERTRCSFEFF